MLTISKSTAKNKAGVTLRKEANVLKYVRDRLEEMPLVGDLHMQLTDEQIIASVKSIGDREADILEFLANAARSANTDKEADEDEGNEDEEDEGGSNIQDISAAAKGSSDLSFALAIADRLKGEEFNSFVETYWHAVKTVADGVLDMRTVLLHMFGAKGLAEMPVVGTYSTAASKKTKKIVPIAGDNEHAHHFLVTEYRDGKNVDVPVNFFHAAADHCPLGHPLVTRIEQMNKARGKGKPGVEAPQSMIEEYRNEPAEFMSTLRMLEERHKKLRALFTDAVAVEQQKIRFKDLQPQVYVEITNVKGTAPIMIGSKEKSSETGEWLPKIGTTYGVRQFLAFDVAEAIKKGGTLTNLLDTVKREPRSADTTTPSITVETANAFFGVLSALRTFTRKTDWEAGVLKGLAEDKEGANKTHVRFLGDVYLALAPMWETIKGRYQQDIDEENKQKEKEAKEKADKQKEYRANLAKDMAKAHNAKQSSGETVIVKKIA